MTKNITKLLPICIHKDEREARKAKDIDLEQYFNCILCAGYDITCPQYQALKEKNGN